MISYFNIVIEIKCDMLKQIVEMKFFKDKCVASYYINAKSNKKFSAKYVLNLNL